MSGSPVLLLVDDESRILSALERALRREGYELLVAESAAQALRILDDRPVDLVLSDHKMPGMSGLEFLGEAAARQPGAARILITGWPEEVPADQLERLGIRALIPKPWDQDALKATVREQLGT